MYCLTPDPTVTFQNSVLILSLGSDGNAPPGSVVWGGYCSVTPLEFSVRTYDAAGNQADGMDFTAIVP